MESITPIGSLLYPTGVCRGRWWPDTWPDHNRQPSPWLPPQGCQMIL